MGLRLSGGTGECKYTVPDVRSLTTEPNERTSADELKNGSNLHAQDSLQPQRGRHQLPAAVGPHASVCMRADHAPALTIHACQSVMVLAPTVVPNELATSLAPGQVQRASGEHQVRKRVWPRGPVAHKPVVVHTTVTLTNAPRHHEGHNAAHDDDPLVHGPCEHNPAGGSRVAPRGAH